MISRRSTLITASIAMRADTTTPVKTAEKIVMRLPTSLVNQWPMPERSRSMYGIAAMNVSQIVGTITPARPLSMWSRSSCRFSRYHGAFDGFGVQSTVEWSCSGALKSAEMAKSPSDQIIIAMNSMTSRWGQTIAVSSTRLSTRTTESCLTKAKSLRRFSWPGNGWGPRGGVIRRRLCCARARRRGAPLARCWLRRPAVHARAPFGPAGRRRSLEERRAAVSSRAM